MASVTFSVSVGGDGSTVTDDANATTGLANGGHRVRFVPALAQVVAVASNVVSNANTVATQTSQVASNATAVATAYDQFDDRWLGPKTSDPTLDNDGAALLTGAAYWNSSTNKLRIWTGSAWVDQTFVPTAATGVTTATTGGLASTTVQDSLEELAVASNLYAFENLGGF
jgi:hypothetical protein